MINTKLIFRIVPQGFFEVETERLVCYGLPVGGVPNVFNEPGTPIIMAEIEIEINKALLCFGVYELYKEHIKTGFRYDDWWKPLRTFFAHHKSAYLDLSVVQIGLDHRFFGGFLASFMQTRITIRNKTCVYIKLIG